MKSITGKLAFAYSTIQKMEDRITELESANAELLDALKAFVKNIEWGAKISGTEGYMGETADRARAAIAKHGGEK